MRRTLPLLLIVILALGGVAAGCGGSDSKSSSSGSGSSSSGSSSSKSSSDQKTVRFAKTKFLLHSGLAFGAFRRYIYKPYKAGTFKKGAPGRTKALVKAGLAGAFTLREVKKAREAANGDPKLRKLVGPLDRLTFSATSLFGKLKSGNFNPKDIDGVNGIVGKVTGQSGGLGAQIKERAVPALGG